MRTAYVQEAVVELVADGNAAALGGAVTESLCGHWEHDPPCPLAPHHTSAERAGSRVVVRTVFVVEPDREDEVRRRITAALQQEQQAGPDGAVTQWQLMSCAADELVPAERELAARLLGS